MFNGLNELYPPLLYNERNAESRKDGYWSFIQKGLEPEQACVYGEFDFFFFAELLDRAHEIFYNKDNSKEKTPPDWREKVFVDLGSGTARLVVGAAALHPGWKVCRGIELLEGIHNVANDIVRSCSSDKRAEEKVEKEITLGVSSLVSPLPDADWLELLQNAFDPEARVVKEDAFVQAMLASNSDELSPFSGGNDDEIISETEPEPEDDCVTKNLHFLPLGDLSDVEEGATALPLAPIELTLGSFDDPYIYFGDADCIFCFSTAMPKETLEIISRAIGRQCKHGTLVITTDYPLPLEGVVEPNEDDHAIPHGSYKLEIVDKVEGWCWLVGGESTAYIHRVVESMWKPDVERSIVPTASLEEQAYKVVKALESGELTDYKRFALNVHNNMAFNGLPESWFPKLDNQ